MFHILKKIKIKAILPAAAFLAAAAIGTTFAWQTWDLDVKNELRSENTNVSVKEEFKPFEHKKVWFENTGSSSVFLRVSYTEYWEKVQDGERYILSNQLSNGNEVVTKNWENEEKWEEIDGWYYYTEILKNGESTLPILDGVTEPDYTSYPEYKDAAYHLYFKAEVVQCSDSDDSKTLNRHEVNMDATSKIFGRSPVDINYENGTVKWNREGGG